MEDTCVTIDTHKASVTSNVKYSDNRPNTPGRPSYINKPQRLIGETTSPMIGKQICHPPEDLTDPDPELPILGHRETLLDHQEGH